MKNLSLSLGRLAVVVASALSLGACSRADYASNSQAASTPLSASVATQPAALSQAAPYVPVAAKESAVVKTPLATSAAPMTAEPVATAPAAAPAMVAAAPIQAATPVATAPAAKPAPKFNLVQRMALHKVTKKLDKLTAQLPQLKKQDARAARGGLDSNLRSAILFGLIGLIVLLFSGVSNVFAILGTIFLIIGLVFLVLWVLDQA
ncbi:MAG: hypothetical protein EOO62_21595 [Hymenobacter sp.]|nr:MAG: hypothetical protein EOO62_21595 [Hymenobacter sp.]